jgi:hypothetical protein
MGPGWLEAVLATAVCISLAALVACPQAWLAGGRLLALVGRQLARFAPRRASTRPIERIAHDARRLGRSYRYPPRGRSFARFEGTRWAYDKVLAEGCAALGIVHLLDVLGPGAELDAERERVEDLLKEAGLRLDDAA